MYVCMMMMCKMQIMNANGTTTFTIDRIIAISNNKRITLLSQFAFVFCVTITGTG